MDTHPCLRSRLGGWTCRSESSGVCAPSHSCSPSLEGSSSLTPPLCGKDPGTPPEGLLGVLLLGDKPFAHTSTAVQLSLLRAGRDLPRSHGEDTQSDMARSSKVIGDTQDHTTRWFRAWRSPKEPHSHPTPLAAPNKWTQRVHDGPLYKEPCSARMGSGRLLCFSSWAPETLAPPDPPTQAHPPTLPQQRRPDSALRPPARLLWCQEGPCRTQHLHGHCHAQPQWAAAPRGTRQGPLGPIGWSPVVGTGGAQGSLPHPRISSLRAACPAAFLWLWPGEPGLKV